MCPRPQQVTHDCRLRGGGEPPAQLKQKKSELKRSPNNNSAQCCLAVKKDSHCVLMFTHIPGANKNGDHIRFTPLRVPGFHQLEELAERITFLKEMTVSYDERNSRFQ